MRGDSARLRRTGAVMRFMTDVQWKALADELTAQGWKVAPRQ
jgi:hypothetical protein